MDKYLQHNKIFDTVSVALFSALIAVCAWVTIPFTVPFTLQTFGIFLALGLLGGKKGTLSVLVYILLGLSGVPVFSGFKGGFSVLFGATGGYIIGFIFSALIFWLITFRKPESLFLIISGFVAGIIVCYAFGTVWFVEVYSARVEPIGYAAALSMCVIPFIIPDIIKISLCLCLIKILKPRIKEQKNKIYN